MNPETLVRRVLAICWSRGLILPVHGGAETLWPELLTATDLKLPAEYMRCVVKDRVDKEVLRLLERLVAELSKQGELPEGLTQEQTKAVLLRMMKGPE